MSSEKVGKRTKRLISRKEVIQAVLKNVDGNLTQEEVQNKIDNCVLPLDDKNLLTEIVQKISSCRKRVLQTMSIENKDCEESWVDALRQLAVRLNDDEALEVIAEAKKSMDAAHSKATFNTDNTTHPRDLNNNVVNTFGGMSFDSIRKSDHEEQKKRETELLKIINELQVETEPLSPSHSEDITMNNEEK